MNPIDQPLSRRGFLQGTVAAAAAVSLPTILPSRVVRGADLPSNKVTLAHIGVGGKGSGHCASNINNNACRVVAVCDAFKSRRDKLTEQANKTYGGDYCTAYRDMREMLARKDIDGVVIATPDHWHVPAALQAVRSGKDVYVEKPLALSIQQGQVLRAECQRLGRIFQYGTQQRSSDHVRLGCEMIRNGRLGKLLSVEVIAPGSAKGGSTVPIPVPEDIDYDLWLGPAPKLPYTADRCTSGGSWYVSDCALGFIAGWGAHPLDIMVWALGDTPDAVPVEYEGHGDFPTQGLFDTATNWDIRGKFANGVDFRFRGGGNLTTFTGERGSISISRATLQANPASLLLEVTQPNEIHLRRSGDYFSHFVNSIRNNRTSIAPIESAVLSDSISHLSDIALRSGRKIRWDPHKEIILDDPDASRRLVRAMREPWTL